MFEINLSWTTSTTFTWAFEISSVSFFNAPILFGKSIDIFNNRPVCISPFATNCPKRYMSMFPRDIMIQCFYHCSLYCPFYQILGTQGIHLQQTMPQSLTFPLAKTLFLLWTIVNQNNIIRSYFKNIYHNKTNV